MVQGTWRRGPSSDCRSCQSDEGSDVGVESLIAQMVEMRLANLRMPLLEHFVMGKVVKRECDGDEGAYGDAHGLLVAHEVSRLGT